MAKKMIIKMNEYKEHLDDKLIEMATISGVELNFDVCVYGGNSYGGGRNEHGEPHFHISDNMSKPNKYKLSISIPTIKEWSKDYELSIIANDSTQPSWNNLARVKKELTGWLSKNNHRYKKYSNLYVIINEWNTLNTNNNNVRQVLNDGEDLF